MIRLKTKVIMNSGKEYLIDMHIDDFVREVTDCMDMPINAFKHFNDVSINPNHISSVESVKFVLWYIKL